MNRYTQPYFKGITTAHQRKKKLHIVQKRKRKVLKLKPTYSWGLSWDEINHGLSWNQLYVIGSSVGRFHFSTISRQETRVNPYKST
ncbi:hypothetical protein ENKO_544 [Klebsiella phage fENko-Kae01]|nr:hypothetical protein [Klebsiella phage fENko-Kae01]WNV47641.1 hypothetical protein [Klebsiella phage fENko-Kae01]